MAFYPLNYSPSRANLELGAGIEPSLTGLEDQHSHQTANPAILVPDSRIEREPPDLQSDVQADYTSLAVAGMRVERTYA